MNFKIHFHECVDFKADVIIVCALQKDSKLTIRRLFTQIIFPAQHFYKQHINFLPYFSEAKSLWESLTELKLLQEM